MDNYIYQNTKDNKARFVLGEKGNKTLVCFGINPSTATPLQLDNTLRIVKSFSKNLGYDSWLMLNVYPQRATNPNDLDIEIKSIYHKENLKYIEEVFRKKDCDVWAAWGTLIEKRRYLTNCLSDIHNLANKNSVNWFSIGKRSKKGHPHHPLYLNKDLRLDKFNMTSYLENINN
jgi:hypothetical protein